MEINTWCQDSQKKMFRLESKFAVIITTFLRKGKGEDDNQHRKVKNSKIWNGALMQAYCKQMKGLIWSFPISFKNKNNLQNYWVCPRERFLDPPPQARSQGGVQGCRCTPLSSDRGVQWRICTPPQSHIKEIVFHNFLKSSYQ